jgi:hypothetical protein
MRRVFVVLGSVSVLAFMPSAAIAAGSSGATSTATTPAIGAPGSNPLGNPITPGIPQSQASTPTTTATVTTTSSGTSTTGGSGLGTSQAVVIVGFAAVLLLGVSFFIWRDARRRAPVRAHRAATEGVNGSRRVGSKQRGKPRKLSPAERRRRKRGRAR